MSRLILHIDFNSFFASVEQQANPFLRGKAIAVTGKKLERSVVAAASREAKRLGVKTAMSTWEAKRVCPSLIFVAGDPEKYAEIHHRFNILLCQYGPCEPFSVDESFVDITTAAKDTFGAVLIAQEIRDRLAQSCGDYITASIGIAPNKLVAKLASEHVKPNGLTMVQPNDVLDFVAQKDLQDICGIGPRIAARLAELGADSVLALRALPLEELVREFRSYGHWLHHAAFGRGDDHVNEQEEEQKSIGHSYTLPRDTTDPDTLKRYLLRLCDKVAWRLRRDGLQARCVHAYVRFSDFSHAGAQHRPHTPISDGLSLFHAAWNLLAAARVTSVGGPPTERNAVSTGGGERRQDPRPTSDGQPIRLVGISASQLTTTTHQIPLFKKERKLHSLYGALDDLQTRYGDRAWTRASLISTQLKARSSGFHFDHE